MTRCHFCEPPADPEESHSDEGAPAPGAVPTAIIINVEVDPGRHSDELTDSEWSAFLGLH